MESVTRTNRSSHAPGTSRSLSSGRALRGPVGLARVQAPAGLRTWKHFRSERPQYLRWIPAMRGNERMGIGAASQSSWPGSPATRAGTTKNVSSTRRVRRKWPSQIPIQLSNSPRRHQGKRHRPYCLIAAPGRPVFSFPSQSEGDGAPRGAPTQSPRFGGAACVR